MPAGRPSKLTPEVQKEICEHISKGNYHYVAAQACGISINTLRHWLTQGKKFPNGIYGEFRQAVIGAERSAEIATVTELRASIESRDKQWWLERKYPHRWGRDRMKVRELEKRVAALEAGHEDDEPYDDDTAP